jgi:hypothetical protein
MLHYVFAHIMGIFIGGILTGVAAHAFYARVLHRLANNPQEYLFLRSANCYEDMIISTPEQKLTVRFEETIEVYCIL